MATSTKWRLNVSANNGYDGYLAIGDIELRTAVGVARPFVHNTFTAAAANTGAANLLGRASLPLVQSYASYAWKKIDLPFAVTIGGVSYTSVIASSYGHIGFGTTGDPDNGYQAVPLNGMLPSYPHILHTGDLAGDGASSFHKIYAGSEGSTFRIRMEMNASYDDAAAGSDVASTIWEVTFGSSAPESFRIDFGTNGHAVDNSAIGDGKFLDYVGTFPNGTTNKGYNVTITPTVADGVATASSNLAYDGAYYTPDQATDRNPDTYWVGTASTGTWQYEFTSPVEIVQYVVQSPSNYWMDHSALPQDWTFERWDGAAWQVEDTQVGQADWGFNEARTYTVGVTEEATPVTGDGAVNLGDADNTQFDIFTPFTLSASSSLVTPPVTINGAVNLGNRNNQGGNFDATPFGLVAATPAFLNGDLSLEPLDVLGGSSDPVVLPLFALAGAGFAGTAATGRVSMAPFALSGAMDAPLALAELGLAGAGYAGTVGRHAGALGLVEVAGAMVAGTAATGRAQMLPLDVAADSGMAGSIALPQASVSAEALAGLTAFGAILLDKPALTAALSAEALPASGDATWTGFESSGRMLAGTLSAGAVALAPINATGAGLIDSLSTGSSVMAVLGAAGAGIAGETANGAAALGRMAVAGVASAPAPDNVGDGDLQARTFGLFAGVMLAGPMGNGAAALGRLAVTGVAFADNLLAGAVVLSSVNLSAQSTLATPGAGDGAATLAVLNTAGTSLTGTMSNGAAVVLAPTLAAGGMVDTVGAGNNLLAAIGASGALESSGAPTVSDGAARFAGLQAGGTVAVGTMSAGALSLRPASLAGDSFADLVASGEARFAVFAASGTGYADAIATGAITLQPATADGAGAGGNIGSAVITVPLVRLDAQGFEDAIGTATVSLPLLGMEASGIAGVLDPVFVGVALNTHTRAVSTYDGLGFNSLTEFNGLVLAATASGIVALTGDTDNGAPITAQVVGGVSDLGAPQFKRVLAGYVGYRAAGALDLTMVTDEHHEYVYKLEPRRLDQIHASRVKFGRGVEGRYWQWKLANRDGADFSLDALTLDAAALSRRVG